MHSATASIRRFASNYRLVCVVAVIASISVSVSIDVQNDCSISNLFIAQDTENGVRVTFKNSVPHSTPQSITLLGEHLPSLCGTHHSRCNMILLESNPPISRSVLVLPVRRGVGLIPFDYTNGVIHLGLHHIVELLPSQFGDSMCQITTLVDFSNSVSAPRNAPQVVGLCMNEAKIQRVSILIDFNNLSRSTVSPYATDLPVPLYAYSAGNLSNFVSITNNLPACWAAILNSVTYYFDRSTLGFLDVSSEFENAPEEYAVESDNNQRFVCSIPRQLARVSEHNLAMYCENVTAEIDMCQFSSNSVGAVRFYDEFNSGVPYYCSPDVGSNVMVSGKTITFNSTVNLSIPLMSNESVYFGHCITNGDSVLFVFTTTTGNVYLLDLLQNGDILLKVITKSDTTFALHQVYNDSVLYTNGSATMLYNTSCKDNPYRVTIDHPYHLALRTVGDGLELCSCSSQIFDSTTKSGPGPGNEPSDKTWIIVVSIVLTMMIACVGSLTVLLLICRKHRNNVHQRSRAHEERQYTITLNTLGSTEKDLEALTDQTPSMKDDREGKSTGVSDDSREEIETGEQTKGVDSVSQDGYSSLRNSSNQSHLESAAIGPSLATRSNETLVSQDNSEHMDAMTSTQGFQEAAGKNASSVVLTLSHERSYPTGYPIINQSGTRVNDATDHGETVTLCNDTLTDEQGDTQ